MEPRTLQAPRRLRTAARLPLFVLGILLSLCIFGGSSAMAETGKKALVLGSSVSGGSSSLEASRATALGFSPVDVVSDATWGSMTAAQFADYQLIIVGDPNCGVIPEVVLTNGTNLADAVMARAGGNTKVGNRLLIGTDPVLHQSQGGAKLVNTGVDFAGVQDGASGLYLDFTCDGNYYDPDQTDELALLDKLTTNAPGTWTENNDPPCGGDVSLISNAAQFSTLTSSDIRGWGCSVHESFPTFPSDWNALALATDTPTKPTCGNDVDTGAAVCGEAYLLIAGSGISSEAPNLSLTPKTATNPVGTQHTVTAKVTNTDGSARSGVTVSFVVTGANAGASGTCVPADCKSDANGEVKFTYTGTNPGDDTINASITVDGSRQSATAAKTWTSGPPPAGCRMAGVGGYTDTFNPSLVVSKGDSLSSDTSKPIAPPNSSLPQKFHLAWGPTSTPKQHVFKMTKLSKATCIDTPGVNPGQGQTIDTFLAEGEGTLDGAPGFNFTARLIDQGEPGSGKDTVHVKITKKSDGSLVFATKGTLSSGNQDSKDGP